MDKDEFETLRDHHQFIRDDSYDIDHANSWEVRMARRHYDLLNKE
jgi:hypothetical protein